MISATRMLCQKYTDLTDAEISYLESYGALLPALANAEQADVFIDCRTVSGRSAIVVCEAKPQTVPSNYRSSILGMLIHWRDYKRRLSVRCHKRVNLILNSLYTRS